MLISTTNHIFQIYPPDGSQLNGRAVNEALAVTLDTKIVHCIAYNATDWVCRRVEGDGGGALGRGVGEPPAHVPDGLHADRDPAPLDAGELEAARDIQLGMLPGPDELVTPSCPA